MNTALAIAALVAVVNPPRRRRALSTDDTVAVALGAAAGAVALVLLAAVATPLIDALDVSAPNLRIGAGLVVALVAAHDLLWRPPDAGAALPGRRAALVPVFFPVLLRPEVGLLALAIGADHGVVFAAVAAVVSLAPVVGWHALGSRHDSSYVFGTVERGAGVAVAGAAAALGVAIVADGVFAI